MNNKKKHIIYLALSAIAAAMIFVVTRFISIPVPLAGGGYVHPGDSIIYIFAAFLPMPYAMAAAAVGASLSDLSGGYLVYIPITFIVKALYVPFFSRKNEKILTVRNILAPLFAGLVCVGGYYIFEGFYLGSFVVAASAIPWNIGQSLVSALTFYIVGISFDAAKLKKKLSGMLE